MRWAWAADAASARPGSPWLQHADGDAGRHVEEAAARDVPQRAPLAARHDDGRLAIVVEEQPLTGVDELFLLGHGGETLADCRRRDNPQRDRALCEGRVSSRFSSPCGTPPPPSSPAATAVPPHEATQAEVRERLRALLPLDARRLEAALSFFDHTGVERRRSVYPLGDFGRPRSLGESMALYRTHAIALGRDVAARALAAAGDARRRDRHHRDRVVHGRHHPVARRLPGRRAGISQGRPAAAADRARVRRRRRFARARARSPARVPGGARARRRRRVAEPLAAQRNDVTPANLVATA